MSYDASLAEAAREENLAYEPNDLEAPSPRTEG